MSTLTLPDLETFLKGLGMEVPIPDFPAADVLHSPLDIARCYLADILSKLVQGDRVNAYNSIQLPGTVDSFTGDLTVVLPKLNKEKGVDIDDFGFDLMQRFPQCELFGPPIPDGKQLRVFFNSKVFSKIVLAFIHDRKNFFGTGNLPRQDDTPTTGPKRKRVVVEFSSPNVVSDLTGKHLRSTLLGAQLANLYEAEGWDVTRINYLGDWGKPLGLLLAGFERFGSDEQLESNPVRHLQDVFKQISELFEPEEKASKKARDESRTMVEAKSDTTEIEAKPAEIESKGIYAERNHQFAMLENGDEKAVAIWKRFREASIDHYTKLYSRLNVVFDEYTGESQVMQETMDEVEATLKEKGICEESEESQVIHLQKHGGKPGTVIIRNREGSSTYILRELAAALERDKKYAFDKMIYVVAADQNMHFQRVKKILELMDRANLADKLQHVSFSDASHLPGPFEDAKTMDLILDRCQEVMQKSKDTSPDSAALLSSEGGIVAALTTSGIFAQACSVKRGTELTFNVNKCMSYDAGTGPYLLSWFAKLSRIEVYSPDSAEASVENEVYFEDEGNACLLRLLAHFPETIQTSYRTWEPVNIMAYIHSVTDQLGSLFEGQNKICATSSDHHQFLEATRIVLGSAMRLIGVTRLV